MNAAHVLRLLRLELRRVRAVWLRLFLSTVAVAIAFVASGHGSDENLSAIAVGTSLGYVLVAPAAMFRDKLEGTLEFLRFLPTAPANIAAAKLLAAALVLLPASLQSAAGLMLLWSGRIPVRAPLLFTAAWLMSWITVATTSWLALALAARFEPESLLGAPFALVVIFALGTSKLIDRFVPDPVGAIAAFAAMPDAPSIAAVIALATCLTVAAQSFRMTRDGVARYRPPRLG